MERTNFRFTWLNAVSLMLVMPAAWVIIISLLKYGLGVEGPFNASEPFLERMGIHEHIGRNVNLLILLGPLAAMLISVFQVMTIEWMISPEQVDFRITIRKKWYSLVIGTFSLFVLLALFVYLVGENS